jgi:hypothetical protein
MINRNESKKASDTLGKGGKRAKTNITTTSIKKIEAAIIMIRRSGLGYLFSEVKTGFPLLTLS